MRKETYGKNFFSTGTSLGKFRSQCWIGCSVTIDVKTDVNMSKETLKCEKRPMKEISFPLARVSHIFETDDEQVVV